MSRPCCRRYQQIALDFLYARCRQVLIIAKRPSCPDLKADMPIPTGWPAWSRLIRFRACGDPTIFYGEPVDSEIDVGLALYNGLSVEAWILDASSPWDNAARRTGERKSVHTLLSPISAELSGAIRAIGLNYRDHAAEMRLALPEYPAVFIKPASTNNDPLGVIQVSVACYNAQLDYEIELAVVLGRCVKDVSPEEAAECVLGYTVANDVTAREWQRRGGTQWSYSKGFDGFCPLGPCIVSAKSIPDPSVLSLQTRLNGELMQDGHGKEMIFSIRQIVSFLSQGTTLPAGTVILTGTPPGIGDGRDPKIALQDGDVARCTISHGLGSLVNTVQWV